VVKRRGAGYSLMEVVVAMAIFGMFLFIILSLTTEMYSYERKLRIDFYRHPQIIAVVARMRRDVLDAFGSDPYKDSYDGYTNSSKTLIIETLTESGGTQIVVWDFSAPEVVVRRAYNVGAVREWKARGVPPEFSAGVSIDDAPNPKGAAGVHLQALDKNGRIALDQIFLPRAATK
jgi:prepilin-type N-terminal cleavage/methylation domain-containing protein